MSDSTDNARGPERIWAWARADNWDTNGHCTSKQEWAEDSDTAYIRADLALDPLADPRVKALVEALRNGALVRYEDYAALQARIAEVEKERDREKAYAAELEVKLAKAVELAEKYQHAFAAQSRKLQAVLHIDGVRTTLAELKCEDKP